MIELDVEQGTEEWLKARSGVVTASMMGSIITPTGFKSDGQVAYMEQLAGEWLIQGPDPDSFESYWMKRGKELEPQARAIYQLERDVNVRQVGFVFKDVLRQVGCSPDGMVGDDGGWENKTPKLTTHVRYLRDGKVVNSYYPQIQASIWITEREWWDFMSFHPKAKSLIVRVPRDDLYIKKMEKQVSAFLADLHELKEDIKEYRL
jgi:hypothetical protein